MSTFVLIPGAGSGPTLWNGVAAELGRHGYDSVAVDLPCAAPDAGLPEYVDAAVAAIGDRRGLVMVGQSLGAFTAAALCERVPVDLLVFAGAMIPVPGETPNEWWDSTDLAAAIPDVLARHGDMSAWDEVALHDVFLHDLTNAQVEESQDSVRDQSGAIFSSRLTSDAWLAAPTRALLFRQDRLFPADFQRRLARERLGLEADEMDGGHLAMLSRPVELAQRLIALSAQRTTA